MDIRISQYDPYRALYYLPQEDLRDLRELIKHLTGKAHLADQFTGEKLWKTARNHFLFVARDHSSPPGDGLYHRIVGMTTLIDKRQVVGHFGEIEDVVTHPDYEKRGIFTMLMNHVHEEAKKLGIERLWLSSNRSRVAARRLYEKLGYKEYDTGVYYFDLS